MRISLKINEFRARFTSVFGRRNSLEKRENSYERRDIPITHTHIYIYLDVSARVATRRRYWMERRTRYVFGKFSENELYYYIIPTFFVINLNIFRPRWKHYSDCSKSDEWRFFPRETHNRSRYELRRECPFV